MKKIISFALLACFIFMSTVVPVFAASASEELLETQKFTFTDSVYAGANDSFTIYLATYHYSDYRIVWTLYRSGVGSVVSGVGEVNTAQFWNLDNNYGAGDYFIRLSCYSATSPNTGCAGLGQISVN